MAQIIMIPTPGKNPMDVFILPTNELTTDSFKSTRKAYTQKNYKDLNPQDWIPNQQFGFRQSHSTVQQCRRIRDVINKAMETQQYCTSAYLDVSQAFDKVWHPGLLLKIKIILPSIYFNLLKSYLNEGQFETKFNGETSCRFHIHSGVPQGSILGPPLYVLVLYTSDLPTSRQTT
jgi:hypothetical protein